MSQRTDTPSGKEDPRRKDIGFERWRCNERPADRVHMRGNQDNELWWNEESLRAAWIAGATFAPSETQPTMPEDVQEQVEWLRHQAEMYMAGDDKFAYHLQHVADMLENFVGMFNAWNRQYAGEKERGDAWMADCKKAEAAALSAIEEPEFICKKCGCRHICPTDHERVNW